MSGTSKQLGYISEKTQQAPCGAYIFHGQELYLMCLYSHKDSWSFHKGRYWRKCLLNWICGQRPYLQFCLSVCLSVSPVCLFSVMKTVCSIELSRWSTNSSSFLVLKDFLGSLWIPLKHCLTPFLSQDTCCSLRAIKLTEWNLASRRKPPTTNCQCSFPSISFKVSKCSLSMGYSKKKIVLETKLWHTSHFNSFWIVSTREHKSLETAMLFYFLLSIMPWKSPGQGLWLLLVFYHQWRSLAWMHKIMIQWPGGQWALDNYI